VSALISSKRYAKAVFEIAVEENNFEEWQNNLNKISSIMQNSELALLLDNPKLKFEQKTDLLDRLLGKINPEALNFAHLLVLKNKYRNATQISEQFRTFVDEFKGIKMAEIVSAIPLDESEKKKIVDRLEEIIGNKIRAEFEVDERILGGFVARVDGSLIDGSIKNRLDSLRNSIGLIKK
jgi:F-type H+-transporting ATPase subunit delta